MAFASARPDAPRRFRFWPCPSLGRTTAQNQGGDTVWIPPGEKHWHGAGPNTTMSHIAMQEMLDGKSAEWMEKVSDTQYSGDA